MESLRTLSVLVATALLSLAGCPATPENLSGLTLQSGSTAGLGQRNEPAAGPSAASGSKCGTPAEAQAWQDEVLRLVNQQRAQAGLAPLAFNAVLAQQAADYACELIDYDYFDHVNPVTGSTLVDRAQAAGYDYLVIGENLAAGQRSPQEVVDAWMNSEGHRANILDPRYTEIGIAVRTGGSYGIYWVQEFGRPAPRVNAGFSVRTP